MFPKSCFAIFYWPDDKLQLTRHGGTILNKNEKKMNCD